MLKTKLCPRCKTERILKGRVPNYCLNCKKEYAKLRYQNNKEYYNRMAMKYANERRDIVNNAKSKPCADCKKTFHPCQMDLDHKNPELKVAPVSRMRKLNKYSKQDLILEIAKCDVVCSNCHRLREYYRTERNPLTKIVQEQPEKQ